MRKKIIAIIPARKFDPLLEGKNILPFGSTNLLQHKILQLLKVKLIDKVVVSTDSAEIAKLAFKSGAEVHDRPKELSGHDSSFNSLVYDLSAKFVNGEIILWSPVITPFIDETDYEQAIRKFRSINHHEYDSLITVAKTKRHLLDQNGPLNFRFEKSKRTSDNLPELYQYVNGISIAAASDMTRWSYNWGVKPYLLEIAGVKTIDICTETDYLTAKLLYEHEKS